MGHERVRFSVVPQRPYSLALTAERYTRFPEVVDRFDGRIYRRFLPVGRSGALLSVEQLGAPARAVLDVTLAGPEAGSPAARSAPKPKGWTPRCAHDPQTKPVAAA